MTAMTNKTTIILLAGMLVAAIATSLVLGLMLSRARDERDRARKTADFYQARIKTMSGGVLMPDGTYVNYTFLSTDNGKTWWDYETTPDGWHIKGPAPQEILQRAQAFNRLVARSLHEPLDPNSPHDRKLLEDAGFEIIR